VRHDAGVRADPPVVAPSREDPLVEGSAGLLGGPYGRHAAGRTRWWWTPLRAVLVLTILTSVLGYLAKSPCRTEPWVDEYQYTRLCYTDVFALYYAENLGAKLNDAGERTGRMSVPYRDHPVEYPAVIGGLMWAAAGITNALHPDDPHVVDGAYVDERAKTFFDLTALLLAISALVTTWAVARLAGRRRVWDAAMFALAPSLFLHGYTNWDLAAVALATLALWAWSSRRLGRAAPVVSGALIGVATATKLYPVLFLVGLLFLCWRARRLREWAGCAAAAAAAFAVCYLPAIVVSESFPFPNAQCPGAHPLSGWRWFWSLNTTRGADWDSLWFQLEHARGSPLDNPACGAAPGWLNFWVALSTLVVVAAVGMLVLVARRRPRLPQVLFLLVAGFLLVNKVDSPQYVLWLVPLAVLARPRWRMFLVWQATEALLLVARFYFFVYNDASLAHRSPEGIPISLFFTAVWIRDLALLLLMALVVRDVLRPEHDVVRDGGNDDPAGGVLDRADDRWDEPAGSLPTPAPA
jgi:uncharacterized membrane protein